ncbi:MAG: hypothetical protein L0215_24445 [Gemmataceae bacterium]|nr:hypothetical protein [Gemmataceae bacterium]
MSAVTRLSLVAGFSLVALTPLSGQYPGYPYPYPPTYPGFGPGGYLQGQASVINASGDLMVKQEQARVEREKANQAKLDTQKKSFDQRLYEKMLTPAYGEVASRDQALLLKRIMTNPMQAEITSGKAHNIMLPYLTNVALQGIQGPPIMLDQQQMRYINVTTTGEGGFNLGILRDGGHVKWPMALRGSPTQKKLDKLLPDAVAAVANDSFDLKTYKELTKDVAKLTDELRTKFHKEEIDGGLYLDGKRFMDSLESAVRGLAEPTASKTLQGSFAATGRTMPELVTNMAQKGLKFAPANPGNDTPYFALYNAMIAYSNGAVDSNAFKTQFAPINLYENYYDKTTKSNIK